jgi:hypothetical protein
MKFSTDEVQSGQIILGCLEIDLAGCISNMVVKHRGSGESKTFPEVNLKENLVITLSDRGANDIQFEARVVHVGDNSLSLHIFVTTMVCVMTINDSIRDINLAAIAQSANNSRVRRQFDF